MGLHPSFKVKSTVIDLTAAPYFLDSTGAADCAPALQQAINDAKGAASAIKTLYAPKGTYKIQNTSGNANGLSWGDGLRLIGNGMFGGTKFVLSGQDFRFVSWGTQEGITTSAQATQNIEFRDFEVDCSAVTTAGSSTNKGFHMQHIRNARFVNLYVHDCGMTGIGVDFLYESVLIHGCYVAGNGRLNDGTQSSGNGIGIGTSIDAAVGHVEPVTITNCWSINNKRYGIFVENQGPVTDSNTLFPYGARIVGNYSEGNQVGIGDCGNRHSVIANNTVTANSVAGIAADNGTFTSPRPGYEGLIANNMIVLNTGAGIRFDFTRTGAPGGRWTVIGNEISRNTLQGFVIVLDATNFFNLKCSDNAIHDNARSGFRVTYSGPTQTAKLVWSEITDNMIWNNGGAATAGDRDGIRLDVPADDTRIVSNRCFDRLGTKFQGVGLVIGGAYTRGSIRDNDLRDNLTSGWSIGANVSAATEIGSNSGTTGHPAPAVSGPPASGTPRAVVAYPEVLYVFGGTMTSITIGGVQVATTGPATLLLEPGDQPTFTYSVAPTVLTKRR